MFEYMNSGILMMGIVSIIGIFLAMILRSGKAYHENKNKGKSFLKIDKRADMLLLVESCLDNENSN